MVLQRVVFKEPPFSFLLISILIFFYSLHKKDLYMIGYFTLFGKVVPMYGLCCTVGIALAGLLGLLLMRKRGIDSNKLILSACCALGGGLVGAKLLFFIVSIKGIVKVFGALPFWQALITVMSGGFVFYGGLLGGIAGLYLYVRFSKQSFPDYFEMYAVLVPLAHGFGRIGCFFAGCCYGIEYDGFPSHSYPHSEWYVSTKTPIGVSLFSVQLVEAACLFLLFAILLFLFYKFDKIRGLPVAVYAGAYSVIRFTLEFFRGDKQRGVAVLSTSQYISLAIFAAAVAIIVLMIRRAKKASANE